MTFKPWNIYPAAWKVPSGVYRTAPYAVLGAGPSADPESQLGTVHVALP